MSDIEKSKKIGQKQYEMDPMDQGLNLFSMMVNQATGIDKGNDGIIEEEENNSKE
ncbi:MULTISPECIES: hypothetical protein [Cytobacillus]|uniref:Uncharacterized protein n=1 Tax=Cytobacillus stercorigallinarum TaxID=2762240 RepID=A0ABR8QN58_9BACI|nr:hypothetical protein [Cytobacillus stercorigallinarum]MBD7936938.1 hypothetical protein [Cytobacillus stercorigallinarum]